MTYLLPKQRELLACDPMDLGVEVAVKLHPPTLSLQSIHRVEPYEGCTAHCTASAAKEITMRVLFLIALLTILSSCTETVERKSQHLTLLDSWTGAVILSHKIGSQSVEYKADGLHYTREDGNQALISGEHATIIVSDQPFSEDRRQSNPTDKSPSMEHLVLVNFDRKVIFSATAKVGKEGKSVEAMGGSCFRYTATQGNTMQLVCAGDTVLLVEPEFPSALRVIVAEPTLNKPVVRTEASTTEEPVTPQRRPQNRPLVKAEHPAVGERDVFKK